MDNFSLPVESKNQSASHTLVTQLLIYNPLYLNCILAGLDDRKGEEAIGYIDDNAHTTSPNKTNGNIVRQLIILH